MIGASTPWGGGFSLAGEFLHIGIVLLLMVFILEIVVWGVISMRIRIRDVIGVAILLLVLAFAQGCVLGSFSQMSKSETLSPEQIKAYRDANIDVYGCFTLMGPPPAGGTTWILVPKGSNNVVTFLPTCMIQMR